jgi:hypothetical protein
MAAQKRPNVLFCMPNRDRPSAGAPHVPFTYLSNFLTGLTVFCPCVHLYISKAIL